MSSPTVELWHLEQTELLQIYNARPANRPIHLCGVDARLCSFAGMDLQGATFYNCSLADSDLTRAKLGATAFVNCDLRGIKGEVHLGAFGTVSFEDVDIDEGSGLFSLFAAQLTLQAERDLAKAQEEARAIEAQERAAQLAIEVAEEVARHDRFAAADARLRSAVAHHAFLRNLLNRSLAENGSHAKTLQLAEWTAAKPGASQSALAGLRASKEVLDSERATLEAQLNDALLEIKAAEEAVAAI